MNPIAHSLVLFGLCISTFVVNPSASFAQVFANPDLNGADTSTPSNLPDFWYAVPISYPNCIATLNISTTPDLCSQFGPNITSQGIPYSGDTYISGVGGDDWDEGIRQTVSGFTPGEEYTIRFYQAVNRVTPNEYPKGRWRVYKDLDLIGLSAWTWSDITQEDMNLDWGERMVSFMATEETHTIYFLPDVDEVQGGTYATVSMALDLIEFVGTCDLLVELPEDTTLCPGQTLDLNVSLAGASYLWNDGFTGGQRTIDEAGFYSVEVSYWNCVDVESITVLTSDLALDLGPDASICEGESIDLDVNHSGATYLWSNGSDLPMQTFTEHGLVWVDVDDQGCQLSDSLYLVVNELPEYAISSPLTICEGSEVSTEIQFFGSPPFLMSYSMYGVPQPNIWTNGSSTQLELSQEGEVEIHWFQDGTSCNATDIQSIYVNYFDPIALDTDVQDYYCENDTALVSISASGGVEGTVELSWQMENMGPVMSTQITHPMVENTPITIMAVDSCGQDVELDIVLNVQAYPNVDMGNDTLICQGDQVILDVSTTSAQYYWNGVIGGPTFTSGVEEFIEVEVSVNGCSAFDSINIDIHPLPTAQLSGGGQVCTDSYSELTIQAEGLPPFTYNYEIDGLAQADIVTEELNYSIVTNQTGEHSILTVSDSLCTVLLDQSVEVSQFPALSVDIQGELEYCQGELISVEALMSGGAGVEYSHEWQTTGQEPVAGSQFNIEASADFELFFMGTDSCGSAVLDSFDIDIQEYPQLPLLEIENALLCIDESTEIAISESVDSFDCHWSFTNGETFAGCGPVLFSGQDYGNFGLVLSLATTAGCSSVFNFDSLVSVQELPVSAFSVSDHVGTEIVTAINFEDLSIGSISSIWEFGDGSIVADQDQVTHVFPHGVLGEYEVCLTAIASSGCSSTNCEIVEIIASSQFFIPNSFTPNGDGVNDSFGPVFSGIDVQDYEMIIWDKLGHVVFRTSDPKTNWNGQSIQKIDYFVKDEVYGYSIVFKQVHEVKKTEFRGNVTLAR